MEEINKDETGQEALGAEGREQEAAAAVSDEPAAQEETLDWGGAFERPRTGSIIKGRVVQVNDDGVLVDVGYKTEGFISPRELTFRRVHPSEVVQVGDEIEVYVLGEGGEEGTLRLSKRRADEARVWDRLHRALETGEVLEVPVVEEVKGGLVVDVGARGFIPASQVALGYVSDLSKFVGQTIQARVIELEKNRGKVILSRKAVLEEERERQKQAVWSTLQEGQVRRGVVKSLTDFGAFIDLGGVDGLLHVSEMAWGRVNHPSEVLKVGDEVEVKVLRLDREKERISLGRKQVLPDPWANIEAKYPPGSIVEGKVVRLVDFGAFVELEPGVDGLVHISQLADRRVATPSEAVQPGDVVKVKVLKVDPAERRISLSIREALREGRPASRRREEAPSPPTAEPDGLATIGEVLGDVAKEVRKEIEG